MAEGGAGRGWRFGRNGHVTRHRGSSRVCKFYIQGNCYYGANCRFRHVQEDAPTGELNDNRPKGMTSPKTSAELEVEPNFLSGACGNRSEVDRVNASEFAPSAQETEAEPVTEEASNSSFLDSQAAGSSSNGLKCHICNETSFHSKDEEQRTKHISECSKKCERVSVFVEQSKDKACGICFEIILEKAELGRKFGILPNCNHCFCLSCIRKWRRANEFDNEITRACPECRVSSAFVCPSFYWVDDKEEKEKLITDYKEALSGKDCKYFQTRNGKCPFGEKCFYRHVTYATRPFRGSSFRGRPFRPQRRSVNLDVALIRLAHHWDVLLRDHDGDLSFFFEDFEAGLSSDSDESFDYFSDSTN